jgi:hypothetical protein
MIARGRNWVSVLGALIGCTAAIACSASGNDTAGLGSSGSGNGGAPSGGTGSGGIAGNIAQGGTSGTINLPTGGSGAGSGVFAECQRDVRRAETIPLALFIMFDQSASMAADAGGMSRWQAVTQATIAFLNAPESAGLGVGIQYFGRTVGSEDCDPATYAQPEVPIAELPGNAQALINSLNRHQPSTETPTHAAIAGGVTFLRQWKSTNPSHITAMLLVTDGLPEAPLSAITAYATSPTCMNNPPSIQAAVAAAQEGAGNVPQVPTYVLGVGNLNELNQIAAAGGTQQAHVISGTTGIEQQVLNALNTIRGAVAIPCEFQIPAPTGGETPNLGQVNVGYTPPGGTEPAPILNVPDPSRCDPANGGWYYDNPQSPRSIVLCDSSCAQVTGSLTGQVDIVLGCETIKIPE